MRRSPSLWLGIGICGGCLLVSAGLAFSSGAKSGWSPPRTLVGTNRTLSPQVAVNAAGDALVVAYQQSTTKSGPLLYATRKAGGKFGRRVHSLGRAAQLGAGNPPAFPAVAVDARGDALVAWSRRGSAGSVRIVAAFRPAGKGFRKPVALSTAGGHSVSPSVAFDRTGDALVLWTRFGGGSSGAQAAFRPAGGTFGKPQTISPPGANDAQAAFDSHGNAVAVWDLNATTNVVQTAFRPRGGRFGHVHTIQPKIGDMEDPVLGIGPDGHAIVVWWESGNTTSISRAACRTPRGLFTSTQTLSITSGQSTLPRVVIDGRGRAVAFWMESKPHVQPGLPTPFLRVAFARRGGRFAGKRTLAVSSNPQRPALATNSPGDLFALWESRRIAAAVRMHGRSRFGPARPISPVNAGAPAIGVDGHGNAVAAWNGPRGNVQVAFYRGS